MNMKNFFIAVLVQIILIALIFVPKSLSVHQGTPLIFNIEAVDPTDPLRGDFLTYRLSDFSEITVETDEDTAKGDIGKEVYIPINSSMTAQANPVFTLVPAYEANAYENLFKVPQDSLFIKGKVQNVRQGFGENPFRPTEPGAEDKPIVDLETPQGEQIYWIYMIEYGVENYFIPEGTGLSFPGFSNAKVRLIIDQNGTATANQVFVDGNPWP